MSKCEATEGSPVVVTYFKDVLGANQFRVSSFVISGRVCVRCPFEWAQRDKRENYCPTYLHISVKPSWIYSHIDPTKNEHILRTRFLLKYSHSPFNPIYL